ncbi:MAG: hypothetical protein ACTSPU_00115 [Promethearchaeota archaeon]
MNKKGQLISMLVFLVMFAVFTAGAWGAYNNNIKTCEAYWGESCERFGFRDKKCYCETGNRTTTPEMIEERNHEIAEFNSAMNEQHYKEKYAGIGDLNISGWIVE